MGSQTAVQRYWEIVKYHGPVRGMRRVTDQVLQIDLYDWAHATNTRVIMSGDEFVSAVGGDRAASTMHYQPVYTAAIRKPLRHLVRNFPVVGASSACVIDLGCGRGKVLHIARSTLQHASLIGVDLHPMLLADAGRNLGLDISAEAAAAANAGDYLADAPKIKLLLSNVNDVDYGRLLAPYDVVIAFNKNSFDKRTTENTLEKIVAACASKNAFYVYNNPVFEASFGAYKCVFEMAGWHKNWNTKVYQIA